VTKIIINKPENKDIILICGVPEYFVTSIKQKGLQVYPSFKDLRLSLRVIRKIFFILKLRKSFWYAGWKYKLDEARIVIIFSTEDIGILNYIKSINPKIRVIFWYWNPVFRGISPDDVPNELCEKWTFDKNDSIDFNLKYNTQFYLDNIKLPQNKIKYDVIFLGLDKGRRALIGDIERNMVNNGVETYFYIVDDNAPHRGYKGSSPVVPYNDYLDLISQSKAILDFVQEGQSGLTLRSMESLFFQKKLITNDVMMKTSDFYNPNNIFIIGTDKMERLKQFLDTPFEPAPADILASYDIDNWIKRFIE
jgi:hypothetical protein